MVTMKDIAGYKLFDGLNETELSAITKLCERRIYETNTIIFDPETVSEDIFLVEEGNEAIQIEIPLGHHEGKIVIHTLSRGETFGWAALGSQHVKTAIDRCLEKVNVIAINGKNLIQLLEKNTHMGYIVMKNLADIISARLSYTTVAFRHEIRKFKKATVHK